VLLSARDSYMFAPKAATACTNIATIRPAEFVADHGGKDVPRGTLRAIIDQARLTVEEFIDLL